MTIVTTPRAGGDGPTTAGPVRLPLPLLLQGDRYDAAEPGTPGAPHEPTGTEPLGLLHRERSGAEDVPIRTADDGAFHQVP